MNEKFCISTKQIIESIEEEADKERSDFKVKPNVIFTFSQFLINFFKTKMKLEEREWLAPYHPYASNYTFQGSYNNKEITIIIPPMGASPIATVAEDVIYCGAKSILLVCGCWAIDNNIKLQDFIIPTHALGKDGTSIYYNRKSDQQTIINEGVVDLITTETKKITNFCHIGKNFSFEAFYRLKNKDILKIQKSGCISMENGELNVLATICNLNAIKFGALFYNYYNPLKGWKIPWLKESYMDCINLQGEIILNVIQKL